MYDVPDREDSYPDAPKAPVFSPESRTFNSLFRKNTCGDSKEMKVLSERGSLAGKRPSAIMLPDGQERRKSQMESSPMSDRWVHRQSIVSQLSHRSSLSDIGDQKFDQNFKICHSGKFCRFKIATACF